jgi:predicted DNA repair protein MutK
VLTLGCCFQCFDDTEKLQWEHIESEWKQEKQKALNALAGTSEEFLNLSLQPEVKNK